MESARPIFEFFEREVKIGLGRKKTIKIGLLGNVNDIISYLSYDIIECFLTMWSATPYKLPWGHIKHSLGSTCYYNHFARRRRRRRQQKSVQETKVDVF